MRRLPLLVATTLMLSAISGCEPQSSLSAPKEPIAIRAIATTEHDAKLLETANRTTERLVTLGDKVIAEWVPMCADVSEIVKHIENAVTRQTETHTDLLVLHSANDVSHREIASINAIPDGTAGERNMISLTDTGSRMLFSFTVDHHGQSVAVIAGGEIRALPKIVSPVRKEMVLSPDEIDKVRVVPSAAN